jgi:hypothetical protein
MNAARHVLFFLPSSEAVIFRLENPAPLVGDGNASIPQKGL